MNRKHWVRYGLALGTGAAVLYALGIPLGTLVVVLAVLACPLMMLMMMHGQHGHGQATGQEHRDRERLP